MGELDLRWIVKRVTFRVHIVIRFDKSRSFTANEIVPLVQLKTSSFLHWNKEKCSNQSFYIAEDYGKRKAFLGLHMTM